MQVTVSAEEHTLLLAILEQRHRELLNEIWHTDHREFKELLKKQERMLDALLYRLRMPLVA
jgi:hypothetical protein